MIDDSYKNTAPRRLLLLKGACMSGKTRLMKKVKMDVKGVPVIVYDLDDSCYWCAEQKINIEKTIQSIEKISADPELKIKIKDNLDISEQWEKIVKVEIIEIIAQNKNCLINDVLDGSKANNHDFYELLQSKSNFENTRILLRVSTLRYWLNVFKRKDKKDYDNTWGMRRRIDTSRNNYNIVIKNTFFCGLRRPRKVLRSLLIQDC